MEDCIFCKIVAGQIPCFKIYEDEMTLAFLDINPVTRGHTLVIPKRHSADLYDVEIRDLAAVHQSSRRIIHAIKQSMDPVGVAIVQLNGRGVNQIIMHYHVHLIPRGADEPELTVSHMGAKEGDMDALKNVAEKIAAAVM